MSMLPLTHYFGKASSADVDDLHVVIPVTATPTLSLVVGKRKRPVGRPKKAETARKEAPKSKLVEYSSSSDSEEPGEASKCSSTPKKKCIHRMYSRGQKDKVAYYARHHGVRRAARHYGVHHKNVQQRMKDQVTKIKNPGKRCNEKGQGRKITYSQELEDKLVAWILEKREAECVAVSTQPIRVKAMS